MTAMGEDAMRKPLAKLGQAWLLGLVVACARIGAAPVAPAPVPVTAGVQSLSGRVDLDAFRAGRTTQASIGSEIAIRATVSLIEATTGFTVATTLTETNGAFVLQFAGGFTPKADTIYYLDAIKGLKTGTDLPNRVGADIVRVRTLARYVGPYWQSISQNDALILNRTTTALTLLLSLRSQMAESASRRLDPELMINALSPEPGPAGSPDPFYNRYGEALLPDALVADTFARVSATLAQDRDPFMFIQLDPADPLGNTLYTPSVAFTVGALQPDTQFVDREIAIVGSGFAENPGDNLVTFRGLSGVSVPATVTSVSSDRSRLTVVVPGAAVSGEVTVTQGNRTLVTPPFYLALSSGHEAVDNLGNLFVANETFGTVVVVDPQGRIKPFAKGLDAPRALCLRNGRLYVTCAGARKGVVSLDAYNPGAGISNFGTAGSVPDPRGIAFDPDGRAWVTDGASGKLFRIDTALAQPLAIPLSGSALSQPRGATFGADRALYVANMGGNNVVRFEILNGGAAATGTPFMEGMTAPWGIAFDTLGNLYVANNKGNSVYRRDGNGKVSPFADMPSPGGLVTDRAGYVYAIDNTSNNVYRITPLGDSSIYASGFSSPTGIHKVGNDLFVLSETNNALVKVDVTTGELSTVARGFNKPFGLTYDGQGGRDRFYVTNMGNGTLSKVERSSGAATAVLKGIGGMSGISYAQGRLYGRSSRWIISYDVNNWAAPIEQQESVFIRNMGIARDKGLNSDNKDAFIIVTNDRRILKLSGDQATVGNSTAANKVVVLCDSNRDPNLTGPRDVAVDSSGIIWVCNPAAGTVTSYNPNGSPRPTVVTGLANPLGIVYDPTTNRVWVTENGAARVTSINPSTAVKDSSVATGGDAPRNLDIKDGTMFLAMDQGIGRIPAFASGGSYSRIYNGLGGYNDIAVDTDGGLLVLNGAGRKLDPTYTFDVAWYSNYHGPSFMWRGDGTVWITDPIRLARGSDGNWVYRFIGVTDWQSGPQLAGVDSNGNLYGNATSLCANDVTGRWSGSGIARQEWHYSAAAGNCWSPGVGAFAADAQGRFYILSHYGMRLVRVGADGAGENFPGVDNSYRTWGMWSEPDGSALYQSVYSHHRVERYVPATRTREIMPFGLSAAEM